MDDGPDYDEDDLNGIDHEYYLASDYNDN